MAEPVQLETIEAQKENIIPLPGGRSARALAQSILENEDTVTANLEHAAAQEAFENELKTADELDDPLEPYLRYVKWIQETYTTGGGRLLEKTLYRVTHKFEDSEEYKSDARYLKLWLTWIQQFSDAPRESFAFLARKGIGSGLALFYEEFAAYLESQQRRTQAEEIYEMGIQKNARPVERLKRKYDEFVARLAANPPAADEPSSPAFPVVRAALGERRADTEPRDPQAVQQGFGNSGAPAAKKKNKMMIFSDGPGASAAPALPEASERGGGWDSIATLAERKKENVDAPRPWAGEILKQEGGPAPKKEKLQIFRDPGALQAQQQPLTASGKPRRPERVFAALELVYSHGESRDECDFDELRARSRGLLDIDWRELRREDETRRARQKQLDRDRAKSQQEDEMMMDMLGSHHAVVEQETEEQPDPNAKFVTKSTTVTVALSSSPKGKPKKKKKSMGMQFSTEPTMTMHTRAANDEIYSIFNQPFVAQDDFAGSGKKEEESSDEEDDDDDITEQTDTMFSQAGQSKDNEDEDEQPDMLKGAFTDDEDTGFTEVDVDMLRKNAMAADEEGEEEDEAPAEEMENMHLDDENMDENEPHTVYNARGSRQLPFMTPIVEQTESLPPSTLRRGGRRKSTTTPSKPGRGVDVDDEALSEVGSSPLQEIGNHEILPEKDIKLPNQEDKENIPRVDENENKRSKPTDTSLISFEDLEPKAKKEIKKPASANALQPKKPALAPTKGGAGPAIEDAQCNPMDPAVREIIFSKLPQPLTTFEGYYDNSSQPSKRTDGIRKYIKAISATGKDTPKSIPSQPVIGLENGDISYTIRKEIGKGAFAPVYLVENNMAGLDDDDENEEVETAESATVGTSKRCELEAIKMETPVSTWEFYITRLAHRRLGVNRATESIIRAHEFHLFKDEAFLVLDYFSQGTLLDLVNATAAPNNVMHTQSGTMEEILVMFFAVELLRSVEALHNRGILHGDLKADNCLLRLHPLNDGEWSSKYDPSGANGWNKKGMVLIDFGRGVDMKNFRKDVGFVADWKTDKQDCPEMREMRPWTYQVDYYGVAAVVHSMLFGKYIETTTVTGDGPGKKRYKISNGMKRYWQGEIWTEMFDLLLNPGLFTEGQEGGVMPCTKGIKKIRERMEEWIVGNCERGVGLKAWLRKVEEGVKKRK